MAGRVDCGLRSPRPPIHGASKRIRHCAGGERGRRLVVAVGARRFSVESHAVTAGRRGDQHVVLRVRSGPGRDRRLHDRHRIRLLFYNCGWANEREPPAQYRSSGRFFGCRRPNCRVCGHAAPCSSPGSYRRAARQEVVNGVEAVIWERDPASGRFTFVSRRGPEMFGYPG